MAFLWVKGIDPIQKATQGRSIGWLLSESALSGTFRKDQWNCSSSVEPVKAFTEDEPPWITVVTSSK